MRLLLDTHVALWVDSTPDRLSIAAREALAVADAIVLSVVVPWELTLLRARGRISPAIPLIGVEAESRFAPLLPVLPAHVAALSRLPWHHRDPFDRMLVAQAQAEGLVIVTADRVMRAYDVAVLPA